MQDPAVTASLLPRQIIVCCDGTNNTLTGGAGDTNVLRLHDHIVSQPARPGFERVIYYDPGVGSPGVLPPIGPVEWLVRAGAPRPWPSLGWRRVRQHRRGSPLPDEALAQRG